MKRVDISKHATALRAKQAELIAGIRLSRFRGTLQDIGGDELDEVRRDMDRDLAIRDVDRDTTLLRDVRAALERIEDNTYGFCVQCDMPISQRRLEVVPWAARCVVCQNAADQRAEGCTQDVTQPDDAVISRGT